MFLLVPAYPGCPGSKAVKRSLLLVVVTTIVNSDHGRPRITNQTENYGKDSTKSAYEHCRPICLQCISDFQILQTSN